MVCSLPEGNFFLALLLQIYTMLQHIRSFPIALSGTDRLKKYYLLCKLAVFFVNRPVHFYVGWFFAWKLSDMLMSQAGCCAWKRTALHQEAQDLRYDAGPCAATRQREHESLRSRYIFTARSVLSLREKEVLQLIVNGLPTRR